MGEEERATLHYPLSFTSTGTDWRREDSRMDWARQGYVALPASVHVSVNRRGGEGYVALPSFVHLDWDRSGLKKKREWIGEEKVTLFYPLPDREVIGRRGEGYVASLTSVHSSDRRPSDEHALMN